MSHPNQLAFVSACARIIRTHYTNPSVVEIGSFDVNGTIRKNFPTSASYTGLDLTNGPGVDVIMSGHEFGETNKFDVMLSSEVFEHNPYWLETFINMIRITKPQGCVVFTCATTGRLEHGTRRTDPDQSPGTSSMGWQYYSNLTKNDFTKRIHLERHFSFHKFYVLNNSQDLYFIGTKKAGAFDSKEYSWLEKQIHHLDEIVRQLRQLPRLQRKARHPLLNAIRMAPVTIASHLLGDKAFQDFSVSYLNRTKRLSNPAAGMNSK